MGAEDMFDLLIFILLLGMSLGIGFSAIIPLTKDNIMYYSQELEDKTAMQFVGEDIESEYDTSLTRLEAVLMTQVQDYCMPLPRRIKGGTADIEITSLYRLDLFAYGTMLNNGLKLSDPILDANARYEIEYNYGADDVEGDDFFEVKKIN